MIRTHLVIALALVGCSKESGEPSPKAKDDPPATQPAAPKRVVELAKVADNVTQVPTAAVAVIIARDGSLSVAPITSSMIEEAGLKLDALTPEPVAKLDELSGKVDAVVAAAPPPPPDDDTTGGEAMALDEGKMGKKESAREKALEQARTAGILGSSAIDPCAEMMGGFGYGVSGFGPGDGSGWGRIGTGHYGADTIPAGLRAKSSMGVQICASHVPIVLADTEASAELVGDVLASLPAAVLGVTVDGDHARTLAATFSYLAGTAPSDHVDVGFTLGATGVKGTGYRGATADETLWTWTGDVDGVALAFGDAGTKSDLEGRTARIRLDGTVPTSRLVATLAALLQAGARDLALGEPSTLAGYGTGSSGGRPRNTNLPSVRVGQPTGSGDLDKATIRRYVRRNLPKLKYCYEKQLLVKPGIEGTVTLTWLIKPDGTVGTADGKGFDDEVTSCMVGVVKGIEFPKPKGGGPVNITAYPFEFHPTGG